MVAPVVAAVASADNNSISYAVSVPTGTANGDLLIGVVASDWGTDAGNAFPAGWTKLTTSSYSAGTNAFHVALYARVASSEPATYTVALDGAGSVAAILRITGWDSASGIAGAVKQVAPSTTGTGTTAPSITPFGSDDLLLTFHGAENSADGPRTWTPPTGMTEDVDRQSTTWTSLEVNHLANPSTPSGAKVATPSASVDTGAGCTISIKAIGGATTVTGTATGVFGFTAAAAGVDRSVGVAAAGLGFVASAAGVDRAVGTAAAALGFAAAGTGLTVVRGVAAGALGFTGVALGVAGTPPVTGSGSGAFGFTSTGQGRPRVIGVGVVAFGFAGTAQGQPRATGAAATSLGFSGAAAGLRTVLGAAQALLGFGAAASGGPPPPPYFPLTDPVSSIRPNLATANARTNAATATIRADTAEATP